MSTASVIARATLVIAIWNLSARLLGFGREAVIAYKFGATEAVDAYVVAFTIPSVLFSILTGALVTVVVAVFNEYAVKGQEAESWRVFGSVFNLLTLLFVVVSILGMLGAPFLVKLIAPNFSATAATLATQLTVIMMPYVLFSGLATLLTGLLNAKNFFGIPAFSGSVINIIIIISALTLGSVYGIQGLAAGTVLGMVGAVIVQAPALLKAGFKYKFIFDINHPGVRKVFYLIAPVMLGVSVNQLYIVIDRVLASGLVEGSISALNYANKIMNLPLSLFVLALSTAVFPTMTRQAAVGDRSALTSTLAHTIKLVFLITIPAAVGLIVLRYPIISLLLERGVFDKTATHMTAVALLYYSIGLIGLSSNVILTRGFYAFQDTVTPIKLTVVAVFLNLVFSLLLIGPLKHGGLAFANSLASLVNMCMLSYALSKRLKGFLDAPFVMFTLKILLACTVMGFATNAANVFFCSMLAQAGTTGLLARVILSITVGFVVYMASGLLLKIDEMQYLLYTAINYMRKKLPFA